MEIQIPLGYKIVEDDTRYGARGRLVDTETGENYLLSNRSWKQVNHTFVGAPTKILRGLLASANPEHPVTILDIGAGEKFRAANELMRKNRKAKDKMQVIGVDLAAATDIKSDVGRVRGDALHLPFRSGTVDVAYSRQSLSYVVEAMPQLLRESLDEVSRVLKPGGVFFLDYGTFPSFRTDDPRLEGMVPDDTTLYAAKAGSFISPIAKLGDALSGRSYNFENLVLVKAEPSLAVAEVLADKKFKLLSSRKTSEVTIRSGPSV